MSAYFPLNELKASSSPSLYQVIVGCGLPVMSQCNFASSPKSQLASSTRRRKNGGTIRCKIYVIFLAVCAPTEAAQPANILQNHVLILL